ncbi:InlB B-repeat-containing protein [Candidatus Saccharibacteria bacterium]|nr:InlB B-repeat-containing protein [Candidatus Saccharibacteria bacterium]
MRITKTPILWSVGGFAVLFFGVFFSFDTLAYTATLSTSGQVKIDVSTAANSAAVGVDNVVVSSTCPFGYDLSIGGTNDNALYKSGDNTSSYLISSTAGTTANPRPIIGDDGGGNSYLGTWGYTTTSNATFSSHFIGLTSSTTLLANKTSASAVGGDIIPVYYGASVNHSIEPGLYKMSNNTAVTYYLTADSNCFIYKVMYNGNGADIGNDMSVTHNNVYENDEITLYASNYKRAGYGFAGWSTVQLNPDSATFQTDLATAKAAGQVFGPNETITATASFLNNAAVSNNGQIVLLYAVWVKPAPNANLQNWQGCGNLGVGDVVALKDLRDNDVYAVAKLADGNCWMIENLRLDYDANIATSNTQSNNGAFGGVFSGLAQPETANFSDSTTANTLYKSDGSGDIAGINGATLSDIGTTNYPGYRMPRYRNDNTNTNSTINPNTNVSNMTGTGQNVYSYGNYYTWAAAMANTNYYNSPTSTDGNGKTSETAGTSLCPTGWKLPRGGDKTRIEGGTSDFYALGLAIVGTAPANYSSSTAPYWANNSNTEGTDASKAIRAYPNNFLYSGYAGGSSVGNRGSKGYYWSSTASSIDVSYGLYLGSSYVDPGASGYSKDYGRPIRCLAKTEYIISYNANGGTGTMDDQTVTVGTTVNLSTNTFSAPIGYEFDGWNTMADGNGTSYADGALVTDLAASGETITLYAQWKKMYIQDLTNAACQAKASNSNLLVYDKRDEKDYTVRYINGNCWMTQNLRFTENSLNFTTSNVASDYTGSNPLVLTWYDLKTSSGCSQWTGYYNLCRRIPDATDLAANGLNYTADQIGVWYNYAGATAGTIVGNSNLNPSIYNVCPKNWTLPTDTQQNSLSNYVTLFSPIYGGQYSNASLINADVAGYFWSATAGNYSQRSFQFYANGSLGTDTGGDRALGNYVRCVRSSYYTVEFNANGGSGVMNSQEIRRDIATALNTNTFTAPNNNMVFDSWNTLPNGTGISYDDGELVTNLIGGDETITLYAQWKQKIYIQDFTSTMCQTQASSGAVTVFDRRDENDYTVRYINGNCWMTRNLRFAGSNLNSTTSNIPLEYTETSPLTLTWYDLKTDTECNVGNAQNPQGYVYSCKHSPNSVDDGMALYYYTADQIGVWYNYAGATAGTITGYSNSDVDIYNVCPKNWTLPSYFQQYGMSSAYYSYSFSPILGGSYGNGNLSSAGSYGYWWSTTEYNNNNRYLLQFNNNELSTGNISRGYGIHVRCVRKPVYVVEFDANGGSGTMNSQEIRRGVTVALNTNTFTAPSDMVFDSWNTLPNGTGTSYSNGESVTDLVGEGETITLYAQWKQKIYIQDFTNAMCQTQALNDDIVVFDERDEKDYTVRYISGACWMTQNLRFTESSLNSTTSNVAAIYTTANPLTLTWRNLTATGCTSTSNYGNGMTYTCRQNSDDVTTGIWYNYAGATAGTITGSSNSTEASYDICPKGWHLPNRDTNAPAGSFNSILNSTTFSPVTGGRYSGGSIGNETSGYWWASTPSSGAGRYYLRFYNNALTADSGASRYIGYFVRCVRNS